MALCIRQVITAAWFGVMLGRKCLSLVKELIETCLVESDGCIQLHAAKVICFSDAFIILFSMWSDS